MVKQWPFILVLVIAALLALIPFWYDIKGWEAATAIVALGSFFILWSQSGVAHDAKVAAETANTIAQEALSEVKSGNEIAAAANLIAINAAKFEHKCQAVQHVRKNLNEISGLLEIIVNEKSCTYNDAAKRRYRQSTDRIKEINKGMQTLVGMLPEEFDKPLAEMRRQSIMFEEFLDKYLISPVENDLTIEAIRSQLVILFNLHKNFWGTT